MRPAFPELASNSRSIPRAVAERLSTPNIEHANGQANGASTDIHGNKVVYGPTMNQGGQYSVNNLDAIEAPNEEVQALMDQNGFNLETSGLKYLSNKARVSCSIEVPSAPA